MLTNRLQKQTEGLLNEVIENTSVFFLCLSASGHRSPPVTLPRPLQTSYIDQCKNTICSFKTVCLYSTYIHKRVSFGFAQSLDVFSAGETLLSGCISVSEGLVGTYCAFSPVRFFFCPHFHCCFVSLDLYSLLFCTKMKQKQNIYNFCMEKKKEECTKTKLFFIVLATNGVTKNHYKKYCHFFICS